MGQFSRSWNFDSDAVLISTLRPRCSFNFSRIDVSGPETEKCLKRQPLGESSAGEIVSSLQRMKKGSSAESGSVICAECQFNTVPSDFFLEPASGLDSSSPEFCSNWLVPERLLLPTAQRNMVSVFICFSGSM